MGNGHSLLGSKRENLDRQRMATHGGGALFYAAGDFREGFCAADGSEVFLDDRVGICRAGWQK